MTDSVRAHEESRAIERYERLERLGSGGMAVVWRATDHKLHREVALKELRDEIALAPEALARFKHEAEAIARLSHPNVVAFYDAVEEGPRTFLVMELVKGEPLSRVFEEKVPLVRAVGLLEKVARGVQHAHENGVVHRDLKPSNVLVARDTGEPKVSDFGLAHLTGEYVTTLTKTGALLGTPSYMAPEQARGDRGAIGPRTDVYALGAMLYEVLAGRPPFQADSVHALVHEVLNVEPVEPRTLDPKVPLDLQTIALKCLAKEPDRRYASAREIEQELRRWLDHEPILARPPSRTELIALWVRRNRRSALLLACLVAAVAIAGLAAGTRVHEWWRRSRVVALELAQAEKALVEPGAVDRIVSVADERTVAALTARLDAAADELRAIAREVYLRARDPAPDEARAGQKPIEGLEAVVDAYLRVGKVNEAEDRVLALATRRLEDRAARNAPRNAQVPEPDFRVIVAAEQDRLARPGTRRAAMLACEALGRIGDRAAAGALGRFLAVLHSELPASMAGEALARVGGPEAEAALYNARQRHGGAGLYWQRVQPLLGSATAPAEEAASTSSEALRERGIRKAQRGDLEGAIADLTSSIALDPKDPLAWFNRGSARLDRGDADGALLDYAKAVELRPGDAGFIAMRGQARKAKGDLAGAIADLTRSLELDPDRVTAWINRGNARRAKGDLRGSIADLTSAIALDRKNPAAWMNRGLSKKAAKDPKGALADFDEALLLDPHHAPTLVNRGNLLTERNELARAIDDLTRAIELAPRLVDAYVNRGLTHTKRGDPGAAIADLTRAIELAPRNATAWWLRGRARKDKGDLAGAIEDVERAVELAPRHSGMRNDLGLLRRLRADHEGSIEDLTKAIAADPKNALAHANRGAARALRDDHDGAIADFTRALELDPRRVDALTNRSRSYMAQQRVEEALADVDRAIELAPSDAMAYYVRAGIRAERKENAGAIEDYGRAIELSPRWAAAYAQRGGVRQLEKDFAGAIADATRALELEPTLAQALANRGAARFATGDKVGAREDLTRYLELDPGGQNAKVARELLEALARD